MMSVEEQIFRANWMVHQERSLEQTLLNAAQGNKALYGESYSQMMTAIRIYLALFSQGKHCPSDILDKAEQVAEDHIDHFVETCTDEERPRYLRDTLTLILNGIPEGA